MRRISPLVSDSEASRRRNTREWTPNPTPTPRSLPQNSGEGSQANGAPGKGAATPPPASAKPYPSHGNTYNVGDGDFQYSGAPIPEFEEKRIAKLKALNILDTNEAEERFDYITKTLATLFGTPIALVSLVDEDRQWFKSKVGLDACATDRNSSFCAWTLLPSAPEVLVVEDALEDPRFNRNPLVLGPPHVRFYAGAPIVASGGERLGSLCLIDNKPRVFTQEQSRVLANFSEIVKREIERDVLAEAMVQQARAATEAASSVDGDDGLGGFRRAVDALSEALLLVDAGKPGFPVVYCNAEFQTLVGLSEEQVEAVYDDGVSIWDFVSPRQLPGQDRAPCEADFAEAVANHVVFSMAGRLAQQGVDVACRFKPAEQAMDVNAAQTRAPNVAGGTDLNPRGLSGYKPVAGGEGSETPQRSGGSHSSAYDEIEALEIEPTVDWRRNFYFVTVVRESGGGKPQAAASGGASAMSAAMGTPMGTMGTGAMGTGAMATGAAVANTALKAPVAPFVDVRVGRLIGKGAHGAVYRGLWDGAPVAVKIMRHAAPEDANDHEIQCQFEAVVSVNIAHPNLVQSFKYSSRPCEDGTDEWETWVVQEHCDMGNLQEACDRRAYKSKETGEVTYTDVVSVLREIAGAISHLHSRGIVHGDLSANNVMLSSRERSRKGYGAKVGDFGLAKTLGELGSVVASKFGTPTHMPPELLRDGILSFKTDVYSFGVLLWQMWTCERPWHGMTPEQVVAAVGMGGRKLQVTDCMTPEIRALVSKCLEDDPGDRPEFDQILADVIEMERAIKQQNKKRRAEEDQQAEAFLNGE